MKAHHQATIDDLTEQRDALDYAIETLQTVFADITEDEEVAVDEEQEAEEPEPPAAQPASPAADASPQAPALAGKVTPLNRNGVALLKGLPAEFNANDVRNQLGDPEGDRRAFRFINAWREREWVQMTGRGVAEKTDAWREQQGQ